MAPQVQNIVGLRSGRLKVLSYAGKLNGAPHWNCLCDCGAMKIVMGQSLRQGKSKSCGCQQYKGRRTKIQPADRYGRLVMIEPGTPSGFWVCQCDCGETYTVKGADLRNGHSTSCGCYQREHASAVHTTHGQSKTPAYIAMKARERLERKRSLDGDWTVEMDMAIRQQQPACVLCDATEPLTIDHLLPLSRGHGLRPGNAVVLCGPCNSRKHNKVLEDLAPDDAAKLIKAAGQFRDAWELERLGEQL